MDATDKTIIRLLQKDGRLSHEEIARRVHLSRPAVHERIRRMEREGVILGYTIRADGDAIGLPLTAFIWVRTLGICLSVGQEILRLSTETAVAEECHRVAGDWCLMVKVRTASPLALQGLLDAIRDIPGVSNTMTTVALSTVLPVADTICEENEAAERLADDFLAARRIRSK